jgi:osmotically-inducible protein OsmY
MIDSLDCPNAEGAPMRYQLLAGSGFLPAVWAVCALLWLAGPQAVAQVNPLSALGRVVSTTMDARTKNEVAADTEIGAAASKQLLEDKSAEWAGVTVLVFQRHVVLAGAVKTGDVKQRVEDLVSKDRRIKSLTNELMVGNLGSLARDTALEAQINAALTAASGVSSVNMRWCATGGHVVLMGVAQSAREASLAQSKVRGVSGVKSLKSHLRVVVRKK